MAFSYLHIEKIKTTSRMTSMYNHNCRKADVTNAIPEFRDHNDELIPLPHRNGQELGYAEAFHERVSELPYHQDHVIRSNQVLGYEVLLTYSRDENVDVEQWKKQSIQWLKDTFDRAEDGKSNIMHAIFHGDEVGNVHIHAFVLPIDEQGHLNARSFTGGSRMMTDLQSSYAKSVENLGIQRGIAGSSAKHEDIRKMYARLNDAVKIPEVRKGESPEEYRQRVSQDIQEERASKMRMADQYAVRRQQQADQKIQSMRQTAAQNIYRTHSSMIQEITDLKKRSASLSSEIESKQAEVTSYQRMMDELLQQMYDIRREIQDEQEKNDAVSFKRRLDGGLEKMQHTDPAEAQRTQQAIDKALAAFEMPELEIEFAPELR